MKGSRAKRGLRGALLVLGAVVAVYVLPYCVLSLLGDYHYTQSGELRYRCGLSVSDLVIYQPLFLRWQPNFRTADGSYVNRGNLPGYFYCPLISLDRKLVHRTRLVPGLLDAEDGLESLDVAVVYKRQGVTVPDEASETRNAR